MATYESLSPAATLTATAAQINQVCAGVAAGVTAAALAADLRRPVATVPNIILDSDIGDDADDASALTILHALADRGECNLLGTVTDISNLKAAGALQAINAHYGRPTIPVGYLQDSTLASPPWSDNYATLLAAGWPNAIATTGLAANATGLYRQLLANAPDGSVTILCTGYLRNLYHLYNSPADALSPLAGAQLIAAKVARVVVMGGAYPTSVASGPGANGGSGGTPEHNLVSDLTGAVVLNSLANTSTPIYFLGYELGANCTYDTTAASASSPARTAVMAYNTAVLGPSYAEQGAWDLQAALFAVRGLSYTPPGEATTNYFASSPAGKNAVTPATGANAFTAGAGTQYYLTYASGMTDVAMGAILQALVNTPPAATGTGGWGRTAGNLVAPQGNVGVGTTGPRKPLEVNAGDGYGIRVAYNDPAGTGATYLDIYCDAAGACHLGGSGGKVAINNAFNLGYTRTTVNGSTSGTAVFSQMFQGASYKKCVCYCNALLGTAVHTFPTAFANPPHVYGSAAAIATATATTLSLSAGTATTGWVIAEGY